MFTQPNINSVCYNLLNSRSYEATTQILDGWCGDDTYGEDTLYLYVRDKHPELWAEILPGLTKWKLLS